MSTIDGAGRNLSVTEPLAIRDIPDEGLHFDEGLPQSWVAEQVTQVDGEVTARGDGRARLEIRPLGPLTTWPPIHVKGQVESHLGTTCVRCLADVDLVGMAAEVDLTLFAHGSTEEDERPLDAGVYDRKSVDLAGIMREAILLALAMNPTCTDEPACTTRTEALLEEVNRPSKDFDKVADPRWAALQKLADPQSD